MMYSKSNIAKNCHINNRIEKKVTTTQTMDEITTVSCAYFFLNERYLRLRVLCHLFCDHAVLFASLHFRPYFGLCCKSLIKIVTINSNDLSNR